MRRGSVDLARGEVAHDGLIGAFGWHGKYPPDQLGVFGMAQRGVAEHRADRRQPGVSGGHAVVSIPLEVGQKGCDERGVKIDEIEL